MKKLSEFFKEEVKVINVGIPSFAEDLSRQGVSNVHVDWQPPAGGNRRMQKLLACVYRWQEKVQAAKEEK
jgi:hypothetical protein